VTQSERVLRALQTAGSRGVTQVDFSLPDVVDGGPPITRLAARVKDLRGQGHTIIAAGLRQSCRVYELVPQAGLAEPSGASDTAYVAADAGLFAPAETPAPRCAIYDDWEDQ